MTATAVALAGSLLLNAALGWAFLTARAAAKYGRDADEAVARAVDNGHELYWANQDAVVLTAGKQPHETVRGISHGDVITYNGKRFRVDPASNNNVRLTEV